ncbi:MAG: DUF4276 family protein [Ectothiorhodospiraceae bacterium AqS1]|nr:DUF4276 family protein [Ectothiorhodospiraceae bacterium AqS1]
MHLEVLIEDRSGQRMIEILLEKILGPNGDSHSWKTYRYKGCGRIPEGLRPRTDATKRLLLDQLPRLLQGYGKSLGKDAAVVVVVDADRRDCISFKKELSNLLDDCDPPPRTLFRIAVEEGEAWLLGDRAAIMRAFPKAKTQVLDRYRQDSVCGTWEALADAIDRRRSKGLKEAGWQQAGRAKSEWASKIAPYMDIERNESTSFRVFRDGIRELVREISSR